jgi:hypothetical protein
MDTRQKDALGEQLQAAVLQASVADAMSDEEPAIGDRTKRARNEKKRAVSPLTGAPTPPGRPKGIKNKLTSIRDAVLEAFEMAGGSQYLYQLSQGTQSDRAAFVGLMSKVLPTQINANVDGGIKLELSWLGQRQIGAVVAQEPERITQVVDLERDAKGKYRIADQKHDVAGGVQDVEPAGGDESASR